MDVDLLCTDFVGLSEPAQLDAAMAIEVLHARLDAARVRLHAAIEAGALLTDPAGVLIDSSRTHRATHRPRRVRESPRPDMPLPRPYDQ